MEDILATLAFIALAAAIITHIQLRCCQHLRDETLKMADEAAQVCREAKETARATQDKIVEYRANLDALEKSVDDMERARKTLVEAAAMISIGMTQEAVELLEQERFTVKVIQREKK